MILLLIYLAYFAVGLPNSMLGAAWPSVQNALGITSELMGTMASVTAGGTIVSSLLCVQIVNRLGTGKTVLVSLFISALGLLGYALASSAAVFLAASFLIGLSAGCLVAALNTYMSLQYEARHLSWVHCFWGIGSMIGPVLLTVSLQTSLMWRGGYGVAAGVVLAVIVLAGIGLSRWEKQGEERSGKQAERTDKFISNREAFGYPGVKLVLLLFLCYCAIESCMNLWITTFSLERCQMSEAKAAFMSSLFFAGITAGRCISGAANKKYDGFALIKFSGVVILIGILLLLICRDEGMCGAGVLLTGLACAAISPNLVHKLPQMVGERASQAVSGLQAAASSIGSMLMPVLTGALFQRLGLNLMPWWLLAFTGALLALLYAVEKRMTKKAAYVQE